MPTPFRTSRSKIFAVLLPLAALALLVPAAAIAGRTKLSDGLKSTGEIEGAHGRANVIQRSATRGAFVVRGAELETDADGRGKVRFSTRRRGGNRMLGFDPRGESVEVRDRAGADVLVGHVSARASAEEDRTNARRTRAETFRRRTTMASVACRTPRVTRSSARTAPRLRVRPRAVSTRVRVSAAWTPARTSSSINRK